MFDASNDQHKIIMATLKLAETGNWSDVSLADIAKEADVSVSELRAHFTSKGAILAAYLKVVDEATLDKFGRYDADERARDRIFDVLMTRFDIMLPHKSALKAISESGQPMPELIRPAMSSIRWMLEAAGVSTDGPIGAVEVTSVGAVFQQTFMKWLKDDDAGQAKTMAALDKGLRRAERWTRTAQDTRAAIRRVGDSLRMDTGWWRRSRKRSSDKESTSNPGPSAPDTDTPSASGGTPSIH